MIWHHNDHLDNNQAELLKTLRRAQKRLKPLFGHMVIPNKWDTEAGPETWKLAKLGSSPRFNLDPKSKFEIWFTQFDPAKDTDSTSEACVKQHSFSGSPPGLLLPASAMGPNGIQAWIPHAALSSTDSFSNCASYDFLQPSLNFPLHPACSDSLCTFCFLIFSQRKQICSQSFGLQPENALWRSSRGYSSGNHSLTSRMDSTMQTLSYGNRWE